MEMTFQVNSAHASCQPLSRSQIESRLGSCTCLPSLGSIESALKEMLGADQRYTSQIAEIIRRDPSLTARLLRLVNAVHYGISKPVKSIEEAVFYLGTAQIRQLAMVTPIIEDFQIMASQTRLEWRGFWRHCIGTALMTREVIDLVRSQNAETDYVAGLIHDVGKIAMASAFPEHFAEIYIHRTEADKELLELEREVLGMDHAELGAIYLQRQTLPEVFVEIVQFHHQPEQRADSWPSWLRQCKWRICSCKRPRLATVAACRSSNRNCGVKQPGWKMLFAHQTAEENALSRATLKKSLEFIPATLERLI